MFLYLLVLYFGWLPAAHAQSLKDVLNKEYKNKILAVRYPFNHGEQEFDSSGQPLSQASLDKWLVYGGFHIEKLKLSRDALLLQGHIAFTRYKAGVPVILNLGKPVKVRVRLDGQPLALNHAQELLSRIFILDETDVLARPEYRRSDYHPDDAGAGQQEPFTVGKDGVKPPTPLYTPEPGFSEQARYGRYQAMVVMNVVLDQTGSVTDIRIENPVGQGLDENAVDAVKTWRFSPATRNDEPVVVQMRVEVAFHLF
jgi:TonB family protein